MYACENHSYISSFLFFSRSFFFILLICTGNDIHKEHPHHHGEHEQNVFLPTKSPKIHFPHNEHDEESEEDEEEDEDEIPHKKPIDTGFRPTIDGKPHKQEKPSKKFPPMIMKHEDEENSQEEDDGNAVFTSDGGDKYQFPHYGNVRPPPHVGPGFFNPETSKNQYPELHNNMYPQRPQQKVPPINNNKQQQQQKQPHHPDNIPPELYHVFGQSPPQQGPFRIEHLLQQIQAADPSNQGPLQQGQNPNVYGIQHGAPFGVQGPPQSLPPPPHHPGNAVAPGSFIFLFNCLSKNHFFPFLFHPLKFN